MLEVVARQRQNLQLEPGALATVVEVIATSEMHCNAVLNANTWFNNQRGRDGNANAAVPTVDLNGSPARPASVPGGSASCPGSSRWASPGICPGSAAARAPQAAPPDAPARMRRAT